VVLGMGSSGVAAAQLVDRLGGLAHVTDDRAPSPMALASLPESAVFETPETAERLLADAALVVTSPGVAASHRLIRAACAAGKEVVSELELAARYLETPMLAVTGTNGKSTTVSLLGEILEHDGRRVFVGGNLGKPLSNAVGAGYEWCVVEVSSFQLEFVTTFRPRVAAVLNLTSDHMDRHGSMDVYAQTKLRIFERMEREDRAVLCRDQTWWRSRIGSLAADLSTFGRAPLETGGRGLVCDPSERILRAHDGWCVRMGEGWPVAPHDLDNLAAAAEMVRCIGIAPAVVEATIATFSGLDHRLQYVATYAGVEYWNDSKATNPGATLRTLEAFDEPVILMVGGVGKGADFGELAGVGSRLRRMVVYGEAADAIERACGDGAAVSRAKDFRSAFAAARQAARPGDVVLLAPACASFDEFDNYAHRGRVFVELVEELGEELGR